MKAANFKAFKCKLRDNTTHSKGLITWAGLAVSVGPASSAEVTFIPVLPILEDPGAASRAGTKSATKVFNHRRRSPWVTTLTAPFPNGQANAGSWLGTKTALYYCAQSASSVSWVLFVRSYTSAIVSPYLSGSFTKEIHAVWNFSV